MLTINTYVALGALLPLSSAIVVTRGNNDPVAAYLIRMCYPIQFNITRDRELHLSTDEMIPSLANSPFPCEQAEYIRETCTANGTTELDFLAEQECLCNGAFWDVSAGCYDCHFAHGWPAKTPAEASSSLTSLSAAECEPSPPFQPYSNLLPSIDYNNPTSIFASIASAPDLTLGIDRFPNNTAVSNYFTPTRSITAGEITGSATARLTSWTDESGIRYTPKSIPPNSGITSTPSSLTTTARKPSASSSSGTSANVAAGMEVQAAGGFLAAAFGVALFL